MNRRIATALAAAALLAPVCARAQRAAPPVDLYDEDANVGSHTDRAPVGSSADRRGSLEGLRAHAERITADVEGVTGAAQHNLTLIALGKLARRRAKDARIRQLGAVVQNDAEEANEALRPVAARMRIAFPRGMTPDQSARVTALSEREPDESFELALLDAMLYEQRLALDALLGLQMRAQEPAMKGQLGRASRSLREAQRATGIERHPMGRG